MQYWGGVSCKPEPEEPKQFTVKFDSDGGTAVDAVTVNEGEKVAKPTDPTKEGFYFSGWHNGDAEFDFETPITADIILKATWSSEEIKKHVVTFKLVGVEGEITESRNEGSVFSDAEINKLIEKIPEGYKLEGTYSDKNCETKIDLKTTKITSATTVFVKVVIKEKPFTIKFSETASYTAGVFNVEDDWVSIEVKFAELPDSSKVQFAVVSDAVESEQSWGKSYFSRYPQVAETVTLDINNWLNEQVDDNNPKTLAEQGATKITNINIQAKEAGVPDAKVASAIVTKKDGTKEAVIAEKDWGSTVTEGI